MLLLPTLTKGLPNKLTYLRRRYKLVAMSSALTRVVFMLVLMSHHGLDEVDVSPREGHVQRRESVLEARPP